MVLMTFRLTRKLKPWLANRAIDPMIDLWSISICYLSKIINQSSNSLVIGFLIISKIMDCLDSYSERSHESLMFNIDISEK